MEIRLMEHLLASLVHLRLLDKQSAQINIEDLGLPSKILSNYKSSLKNPEGKDH